jgi:carbonic anhydrase
MPSDPSCLTSKLLAGNRAWSEEALRRRPGYFRELAREQRPKFLWIGCSDSRVPAETVVDAQPGEIFVHRNIANQVIVTDFNCLSVIQYALVALRVEHIIVCGHDGCGGIQAALQPEDPLLSLTNKWLLHLKDVYRLHEQELRGLPPGELLGRMVRLNLLEQVRTIAHTSMMQTAWRHGHRPTLHGWVYGLENGRLEEIVRMDHTSPIDPIYRIAD